MTMKMTIALSAALTSTPKKPNDNLRTLKRVIKKYGMEFEVEYGTITKKEALAWVKYFDYMYHAKNKSIVSDEVYDILKDTMLERWPKTPYLKKIGHRIATTGKVKAKEVVLPVFMPSMDKLKSGMKKLTKFIQERQFILGDKLDGISLLIHYANGTPAACYTRGDGTKGQDVSGVLPALNIPRNIPVKGDFYVRCEFLIPGKKFAKKHSKHHGTGDYKTARNMGGGLLTRNEPSDKVRDFDVTCYEISKGKGAGQKLSAQLAVLKRYGFTVVRHRKVAKLTEESIVEWHDKFKKTAKYEIDGIIVTQDISYKNTRRNPKHANAFKINSLESSMVVPITEVEWRKSRLGKWIPRIHIDPVLLGGVTVEHFTGHSFFYIQNGFTYKEYLDAKKSGKKLKVRPLGVGAMIRVIRSGDVIPYIMSVEKPVRRPSKPEGKYNMDANNVHAIVPLKGDIDAKKKRMVHFFEKMDVEGIKDGMVEKLYAAGFKTIKKIMEADAGAFMKVEGIKEKTAENLVKNIRKGLANPTFSKTAYASGIFGGKLGTRKFDEVVALYPNILGMADLPKAELTAKIEQVAGFQKLASTVAQKLPKFIKFLDHHNLVIVTEKKVKATGSKLDGQAVLFTGVRDPELMKAIKANGGTAASTAKNATMLVTKADYSNKKTEVAEDRGIPIYTVEQFKKKYKL